jgi:hypothetical protein
MSSKASRTLRSNNKNSTKRYSDNSDESEHTSNQRNYPDQQDTSSNSSEASERSQDRVITSPNLERNTENDQIEEADYDEDSSVDSSTPLNFNVTKTKQNKGRSLSNEKNQTQM